MEGEAYLHPILAVLRLKNITHVYDFKTGAGMDKWAFEGEVSNRPPSTPDVPTSATVTYSNIEADDGVYEEYTTQNNNNYAAQRFNFSIDETSPTKINVTWKGKGDHDSLTDGATLYIYNFTAGAYEQLDSNSVSTDATLTGEKTSSISSYINTGNVTVLVEQNSAHSDPDTSYIATDYIRVVITP